MKISLRGITKAKFSKSSDLTKLIYLIRKHNKEFPDQSIPIVPFLRKKFGDKEIINMVKLNGRLYIELLKEGLYTKWMKKEVSLSVAQLDEWIKEEKLQEVWITPYIDAINEKIDSIENKIIESTTNMNGNERKKFNDEAVAEISRLRSLMASK